jgi:histone H3/H4
MPKQLVAYTGPMTFNWLAHTDTQLQVAASRRVLRSGGRQRWASNITAEIARARSS